jgi:predicted transcriptional regulator
MGISIDLPPELENRLGRMAEDRHVTTSGLIEEAVRQLVEQDDLRAEFLDDARRSMEHYRRTGLHITGEELSAWLKTWGTDDETGPPQCHR